jgi:hypothetical protein
MRIILIWLSTQREVPAASAATSNSDEPSLCNRVAKFGTAKHATRPRKLLKNHGLKTQIQGPGCRPPRLHGNPQRHSTKVSDFLPKIRLIADRQHYLLGGDAYPELLRLDQENAGIPDVLFYETKISAVFCSGNYKGNGTAGFVKGILRAIVSPGVL